MRKTFVFRDGRFIDKRTGSPMVEAGSAICRPMIIRDIPTYTSPIDGRPITSRSERREDLKRNNCVEWEPGMGPKAEISERAARKYGVTQS